MLPEVVTPSHAPRLAPEARSLLQAWSSVRSWRRIRWKCTAAASCEIVHAHCFAAGMAAVRSSLRSFTNWSNSSKTKADTRLGANAVMSARILKSAEWFTLSRSAAIVVRTQSVRRELLRRGAAAEHVFVIPHPLPTAETESPRILPLRKYESGDDAFTIFSTLNVGTGWQGWLRQLLAAAQSASPKLPNLALHLEVDQLLQREAWRLLIELWMRHPGSSSGRTGCRARAVTLLFGGGRSCAPTRYNTGRKRARLGGVAESKPLLAADLDCNRDVSANGSGSSGSLRAMPPT